MRNKIYDLLHKTYTILLTISFFGGALPIIPFIFAIIIGGPTAQAICTFLYKTYYQWIIAMASLGVLVGWVAMYIQDKKKA